MSRVLIVGAGLTGSLCACLLKRELQSKVHIVVWDKARGSGQRCIQTFIHKMNTLTIKTPQTNSITLRTEPIRIMTQSQVLLNSARVIMMVHFHFTKYVVLLQQEPKKVQVALD